MMIYVILLGVLAVMKIKTLLQLANIACGTLLSFFPVSLVISSVTLLKCAVNR